MSSTPTFPATGRCRSCRAPLIWATTSKGKLMPVDAEPTPDGNLILTASPGGAAPTVIVLASAELPIIEGERRKPHKATCPDAAAWQTRTRTA